MFTFENPSAGVSIRAASRPIILYTEKKIRRNIFKKNHRRKIKMIAFVTSFANRFKKKRHFRSFFHSTFFVFGVFFSSETVWPLAIKKLKKVLMKKMTGCDHKWIQEVLRAIVPISATKPWLLGTGLGSNLEAHFKPTRNVETTRAQFSLKLAYLSPKRLDKSNNLINSFSSKS